MKCPRKGKELVAADQRGKHVVMGGAWQDGEL
jgi:hypothetical protein